MVIINKNESDYELDLSRFSNFLEGVDTANDVIENKEIKLGDKLSLPPKTPVILEWKQ